MFAVGKLLPWAIPLLYYVAMGASRDELEASIIAFSAGTEGDVASSPSLAVKNNKSANRYLFAAVKLLLFPSPANLLSWNGHFQ